MSIAYIRSIEQQHNNHVLFVARLNDYPKHIFKNPKLLYCNRVTVRKYCRIQTEFYLKMGGNNAFEKM